MHDMVMRFSKSSANIYDRPFTAEGIEVRPLRPGVRPERVVVARFQAFGDTVISLPALAGVRRALPDAVIEFVTSAPYTGLLEATGLVDAVWSFTESIGKAGRIASAASLAARMTSPDLFIDLQRSGASRLLRRMLRPPAWVSFDRYAPAAALDRYMQAVHAVGLGDVSPEYTLDLVGPARDRAGELLREAVRNVDAPAAPPLVCLNPAGGWGTKNWPVEHYIELGEMLVDRWGARIVLLGTEHVRRGARAIADALGNATIDLTGRTSVVEALAIVKRLRLMVSDDSGLMHLAWTAGVPTIGIMGATRSVWSRPCGSHSFCFGSEDLPCGACLNPVCSRGDLHCLTRVGPAEVYRRCGELLPELPPLDRPVAIRRTGSS